jgi:uncharacterized protein YuzE
MVLTFDEDTNAFYLKIHESHGKIVKTISLGNDKFMDIDELGHIVGMEILSSDNESMSEIDEVIRRTEEIQYS